MLLYIPNTTGCNGDDLFMPWLLWMLGAFLLGLLLGWLLKQLFGGSGDGDQIDYSGKIRGLEADLAACRKEKTGLVAAATAMAATTKIDDSVKDDYTKVEGIGPKIKELLNKDGLWSFKQLSEASVDRMQKVLDAAGPAYKVHNPKTWAEQALMAHEGKWDALKKWQDELLGGL
jgi:predicted flap endonuclease-1-like 5' DNA nuclease